MFERDANVPKKVISMPSKKFVTSLLALTVSAAVVNTSAASGQSQVSQVSQVSQPDAQGARALPVKKMGSGVEISYRIEGTPTPGIPLIVDLTTSSRTDAQITVRGGEGLVVKDAGSVLTSAAGQITQHRIEVTPQTQGRLYLYVESSANARGSSNAIAVPVGKSDVQRKPSGTVQSMPGGERIISVPAKQ